MLSTKDSLGTRRELTTATCVNEQKTGNDFLAGTLPSQTLHGLGSSKIKMNFLDMLVLAFNNGYISGEELIILEENLLTTELKQSNFSVFRI